MDFYTKEALDKLNKRDLLGTLISLQHRVEEATEDIPEQIRQLNQKFAQLESEIIATKQTNFLLTKWFVEMERHGAGRYSWLCSGYPGYG